MLVDGKEDLEWSDKTDILIRENYECLEHATELLSKLCRSEAIHRPEKYMSYAKCSDPEGVYAEINNSVDLNMVNVQRDGRKVYLFANGISKGEAVERFMLKRRNETILSAGDNLMDISMLKKANLAFVNKAITDLICRYIAEMRMKGMI